MRLGALADFLTITIYGLPLGNVELNLLTAHSAENEHPVRMKVNGWSGGS